VDLEELQVKVVELVSFLRRKNGAER